MPELPDVTLYLESLDSRVVGRRLDGIRLSGPFVLRSVQPTADELSGKRVEEWRPRPRRFSRRSDP
jgi:formamidopyrimidine-DNA glycosylase